MARLFAFRSGSRDAQKMMTNGVQPFTEYHDTFYFESPDPLWSRRWWRRKRDQPETASPHASSPGAIALDNVPAEVARRHAAGESGVPDFALVRHQEKRLTRIAWRFVIVTFIAIAIWAPLNAKVWCAWVDWTPGRCEDSYANPPAEIAGLIAAVLAVTTACLYALAGRVHARATKLEAAESARQHRADLNRTPGWREP